MINRDYWILLHSEQIGLAGGRMESRVTLRPGTVALCESRCSAVTPNLQFQRSVNSRLRRLSPPAELGRWTSCSASGQEACVVAIVTALVMHGRCLRSR